MSRQNKVNPGKYTQAGRLSQDDVAREMKKQREAASPLDGAPREEYKPRVRDEERDGEEPEEEQQEEQEQDEKK